MQGCREGAGKEVSGAQRPSVLGDFELSTYLRGDDGNSGKSGWLRRKTRWW